MCPDRNAIIPIFRNNETVLSHSRIWVQFGDVISNLLNEMLQEQLLRQQKEEQKRICEGKPVVMKEIPLLAR